MKKSLRDLMMAPAQLTGGYAGSDNFLFRHLILTVEQWEMIMENLAEDFEVFCRQERIDFVSVQRQGDLDFLHLTSVENLDSISSVGLSASPFEGTVSWISDLGEGIYVISEDDLIGLDNLQTYCMDWKEDEVSIVTGSYVGPYLECVKGFQHEGYVVLQTSCIKGSDLETNIESLDEFLWRG